MELSYEFESPNESTIENVWPGPYSFNNSWNFDRGNVSLSNMDLLSLGGQGSPITPCGILYSTVGNWYPDQTNLCSPGPVFSKSALDEINLACRREELILFNLVEAGASSIVKLSFGELVNETSLTSEMNFDVVSPTRIGGSIESKSYQTINKNYAPVRKFAFQKA
jgi:hypothetical protein